MASETGNSPAFIIRKLLEKPRSFSFVQAVRLLELQHRALGQDKEKPSTTWLRIVPELSLAHPGSDIARLESRTSEEEEQYKLFVTFLSLYGASSPLPTFYTEELIEEARADKSGSREFLDIFNHALYTLYYRACLHSKLGLRSLELQDKAILDLQHALLGFENRALRTSGGIEQCDLAFIDLFTRHSRSAEGLAAYAAIRSSAPSVSIEQCVVRRVPIPADQRAMLGSEPVRARRQRRPARGCQARLGTAVIGKSVIDRQGGVDMHIHGLNRSGLARFVPGGEGRKKLEDAVRRYLYTPLAWDVVLHIEAGARDTAKLGHARLGGMAFLASPDDNAASTYRWYRTRA